MQFSLEIDFRIWNSSSIIHGSRREPNQSISQLTGYVADNQLTCDRAFRTLPILTLHIVDRRIIARRRPRRDDLMWRESMRPGTRQIVYETRDPDEKQEKQEHEIEHQQGVQGHQLHRARATRSTITRVHPRTNQLVAPAITTLPLSFCLFHHVPPDFLICSRLLANLRRSILNFDKSGST